MSVKSIADKAAVAAPQKDRPKTVDEFLAKWDVGVKGWLFRSGDEDRKISSAEILGNGGWIDFYLDLRRLSGDEQTEVGEMLGVVDMARLLNLRMSALYFSGENAMEEMAQSHKVIARIDRLLDRPTEAPDRKSPYTTTLEQFVARYDIGQRDRVISRDEVSAALRISADLILDLANLSAEDQVTAYRMLTAGVKAEIKTDAAIYRDMHERNELSELKPLHVDPLAQGIAPKK